MNHSIPEEISFTHVVLEGTPYQVGRQQAEMLKDDPQRVQYLTPTPPFLAKYAAQEADQELAFFDRYCPGIGQELQGAADALGVPIEDIAFLGGKPMSGSHCSHFAILASASKDHHLLVGQNEDCGPGDLDLRLCTTRVQEKAAHIGFSDMILGRVQGMNEHGLCITTSWGTPGAWPDGKGLPYFVVVRAVLDRCQSVEDALDVIAGMPIAWSTNYIVTDRGGRAALIEVAGAHRGVKRIGPGSSDPFLWATNHYTLPAMIPHDIRRMRQSVLRHQAIASRLKRSVPHVAKNTIRGILSEPMPEGVCMHHYSDGLGTLWSMIFDVTDTTVDICFGAPSSERNTWRSFGLEDPPGITEYVAHLPDEPSDPAIWERLPPGSSG
jgi:predicted choloylglycine hydrolase